MGRTSQTSPGAVRGEHIGEKEVVAKVLKDERWERLEFFYSLMNIYRG